MTIALCVWVKDPYIKKCTLLTSQKPVAQMSALASSCLFTERGMVFLPVRGSNGGSLSTFLHTSLSQFTVMSCISLRQFMICGEHCATDTVA